ncbi:M48 family metalloprotease [Euhalothece natronophila Z-M001]|uniref:M48 family metalloprotease n=1 Tax=Euhalothece natronophila Z-M001 TaxID=522448 RepID=A0A5B8NNH8_9CHRO|nr:M48 family metallopeptidase [Euhalothece natronophila]QDZ40608.1 M48 family metalloprotease [Euhalothece natronophila Z-M001]
MNQKFLRPLKKLLKRSKYGLISLLVIVGLVVGTPQVSQAFSFSFIDLIFRGVQVFQLSNMSDSQEVELGKRINQQLVNREFTLYENREVNRYVDQIGERLVDNSSRPDLPFTFQVVDDDRINAFATMGGFVYLHTGLIKEAENEAELAGVIGHEIGHITARHAIQQMRQRAIAQGLLSAAGLDRSDAVQIGVELAVSRPNSRQDEFEADEKGLEMITASGYAPGGLVSFMEKLKQQGGSPPTFLSTHPAVDDRIDRLQANMDNPEQGDGLNAQAYQQRTQALR